MATKPKTKRISRRKLIVHLDYDHDVESPNAWGTWSLYSFCQRHASFRHPQQLGITCTRGDCRPPLVGDAKLRRKLQAGAAFFLSYFEHGDCIWFRADGEIPAGVEFQWDGVKHAGLLVWESPVRTMRCKPGAARAQWADRFLQSYTAWCNGQLYCYSVEDWPGFATDSCGGYYDLDDMLAEIAPLLVGRDFELRGAFVCMEKTLRTRVKALEDAHACKRHVLA